MRLGICLDTNRYRDMCAGDHELIAFLERVEWIYLPFIVMAELRAGFVAGSRGRENEKVFHRFLGKPGVEVLWPSEATTRNYAQLFRQLRAQGTPIPTNDLWIAALVEEHGLMLCTRDRHFAHLPQLTLG